MNKPLRAFSLTLFFFIGIIIPACDWTDPCDCSGYRYFDVTDVEIQAFKDARFRVPVTPGERLNLAEFEGFYIDYLVDYHACVHPKTDWSLSLMSSAYACSCALGYGGSKLESLLEFSINTLGDFDEEHPAGSSINDLLVYEGSYMDEGLEPLSDFLTTEMVDKLRYEDMKLSLTKAPTLDSVFQVQLVMELSTGERFEVESQAFVLFP